MDRGRILIVEDEVIIGMELESQMQSLGYEVTSIVNTGDRAIEKAEADKPDLILMDIRIKGEMDGIDAAEIIRTRFGIPVVFSTAYLDEERIQRAKITMPFGYVLKPIQARELKVTVAMALYVAKVDKARRQTEEKLRDSEEKYKIAFKTSPDGVNINALDGLYVDVNDGFTKLTGYTPEDVIGRLSSEIKIWAIPEDRVRLMEELAKNGFVENLETKFRCKDGSLLNGLITARTIILNGEPHTLSISRDITEQKRMEEQLQESQFLFSQMFEQSNTSIQLFDPNGYCLRVNSEFCELYGVQAEDIVDGKYNILKDQNLMSPRITLLVNGIFNDRKMNKWEGLFDIGASADLFEIPVTARKQVYIETQGYPILDSAGRLKYVVLYSHDITERKRIEAEFKKSAERFRDLVTCSTDWIWEVDGNGRYTYVSGKIEAILGYRPEEIIGKTPFDLMPKKEAERIASIFNGIVSGKNPIVDLENWNLTREGKLICFLTNGVPILDDTGNCIGYRGVDKDITAFRNAEKAI
ncbi:MAG: PAS domain S-box protein [bacterium]